MISHTRRGLAGTAEPYRVFDSLVKLDPVVTQLPRGV